MSPAALFHESFGNWLEVIFLVPSQRADPLAPPSACLTAQNFFIRRKYLFQVSNNVYARKIVRSYLEDFIKQAPGSKSIPNKTMPHTIKYCVPGTRDRAACQPKAHSRGISTTIDTP